jgi:hypothetical protein
MPRPGDFHPIDCPTHGKFAVSDTAMKIRRGMATPSHWERSLERAKLRAATGKRLLIEDRDFL